MTQALDPEQTYVHLTAEGEAAIVPGGAAFWQQGEEAVDAFGRGWLITESGGASDWPHWEMHPEADEFVYLLSGAADFVLQLPEGVKTLHLRDRAAVVVPRGVWHTAKLHGPTRLFFVTMGAGTQHRPIEQNE